MGSHLSHGRVKGRHVGSTAGTDTKSLSRGIDSHEDNICARNSRSIAGKEQIPAASLNGKWIGEPFVAGHVGAVSHNPNDRFQARLVHRQMRRLPLMDSTRITI
jgi:hypothetical protein